MKTNHIKETINNLIEPKFSEVVTKLKDDEIQYFIHHITRDLHQSIHHWDLIIKETPL
jgi:hypothetical protein